jgi:hypothetical protein
MGSGKGKTRRSNASLPARQAAIKEATILVRGENSLIRRAGQKPLSLEKIAQLKKEVKQLREEDQKIRAKEAQEAAERQELIEEAAREAQTIQKVTF